jgi:hypothetical protein
LADEVDDVLVKKMYCKNQKGNLLNILLFFDTDVYIIIVLGPVH